jgi:hypothetical protein
MANIIRHQIRKRKKSYYNRFKNRNSKIWWKTVNEINGKTTKKEVIKLSAEELNIGFHQVWKEEKESDISSFIKPPQQQINQKTIKLTPDMVIKELKKLDVTKAPGPDSINNKILKDARFELSDILAHLFNISIQHSFIPAQWKIANVTNSESQKPNYTERIPTNCVNISYMQSI